MCLIFRISVEAGGLFDRQGSSYEHRKWWKMQPSHAANKQRPQTMFEVLYPRAYKGGLRR